MAVLVIALIPTQRDERRMGRSAWFGRRRGIIHAVESTGFDHGKSTYFCHCDEYVLFGIWNNETRIAEQNINIFVNLPTVCQEISSCCEREAKVKKATNKTAEAMMFYALRTFLVLQGKVLGSSSITTYYRWHPTAPICECICDSGVLVETLVCLPT